MIRISYILLILLLFACKTKKEKSERKELLVQEPSEMALLMRQMYEYNKSIRSSVVKNNSLISFPEDFLAIHSADLTDPNDRDSTFELLSSKYLHMQKSIQNDSASSKEFFNRTISSCISCHEVKCQGPIPKIRRLFIE